MLKGAQAAPAGWGPALPRPPALATAAQRRSRAAPHPPSPFSLLSFPCSAEGYGYSDKENVCFACAEGCASCSERSCAYCLQGWAFADGSETTCTKVGGLTGEGEAGRRGRVE